MFKKMFLARKLDFNPQEPEGVPPADRGRGLDERRRGGHALHRRQRRKRPRHQPHAARARRGI